MRDPVREKRLRDMLLGDLEDALNALELAIQSPALEGTHEEDTLKEARARISRVHLQRLQKNPTAS